MCNAVIQHHFYYAYFIWYPNFNGNLKTKLQTPQTENKCLYICLNSNNRTYIGRGKFQKINWLSNNDCFKQWISSQTLCQEDL